MVWYLLIPDLADLFYWIESADIVIALLNGFTFKCYIFYIALSVWCYYFIDLIMTKYSKRIRERIIELIEKDAYSVSEICDLVNISRKSYNEWLNLVPEFKKAVDDAHDRCNENLLFEARHALRLKVNGYRTSTITYKYVPDDSGALILKDKTVRVNECQPDTRTIMDVIDRHNLLNEKTDSIAVRQKPIILTVGNDEERSQFQPSAEKFMKCLLNESSGRVNEKKKKE